MLRKRRSETLDGGHLAGGNGGPIRRLSPRASGLRWLAALAICVGGCIFSDDFSVSGELRQRIATAETDVVVIRCYCPNREIVRSSEGKGVELFIEGTHSSQGYHGKQKKPRTVSPGLLELVESREGDAVTLESREYTYIHHAYLIDSLRVVAPAGQEVLFEPIPRAELEGRRVGG